MGSRSTSRASGSRRSRTAKWSSCSVSIGVRSRWRRGLVIGGIVGLAPGFAIRDAREHDRRDRDIEMIQGLPTRLPEREADVDSGLPIEGIWAATGAVAGLGVGTLLKEELWETIVWDTTLDRGTDMTFNPLIDVGLGREGHTLLRFGGTASGSDRGKRHDQPSDPTHAVERVGRTKRNSRDEVHDPLGTVLVQGDGHDGRCWQSARCSNLRPERGRPRSRDRGGRNDDRQGYCSELGSV